MVALGPLLNPQLLLKSALAQIPGASKLISYLPSDKTELRSKLQSLHSYIKPELLDNISKAKVPEATLTKIFEQFLPIIQQNKTALSIALKIAQNIVVKVLRKHPDLEQKFTPLVKELITQLPKLSSLKSKNLVENPELKSSLQKLATAVLEQSKTDINSLQSFIKDLSLELEKSWLAKLITR